MAQIDVRRFAGEQLPNGAVIPPMTQEQIVAALIAYKKQNPKKYEAKKAALLARYGLSLEQEPVEVKDESDNELEAIKEKVSKPKKANKKANKKADAE